MQVSTAWANEHHPLCSEKYRFELARHLSYSPDLASADYFLFLKMKTVFSGSHFDCDDDVIAAVDPFLEDWDTKFHKKQICMLHDRWTKAGVGSVIGQKFHYL